MTQANFYDRLFMEPNSGCWLWEGPINQHGYAKARMGGSRSSPKVFVHRWIHERTTGKIPNGLFVCHKCDVPSCVNPGHLFVGTNKDNVLDMNRKGRQSVGEHRPMSKLTEQNIKDIRDSTDTLRALGERFGVAHSVIARIKQRKKWKHVA